MLGSLVAEGPLAVVRRGSLQGRAVAVKQAVDRPGAAAALRREARILSAVDHPAIVPVLDLLDDGPRPTLILGWADGGSLDDLLADGPLLPTELLHLLRPLAGGLEALHRAGVAHLDVTVRNVLLAAVGPVLIDPAPPGGGTPGYTDPVVADGGPASARSDVFGLAACAHVALTGRVARARGGVAVGLSLPTGVIAVLAAGLHPDPRRRPPTPGCFVDRLEAALTAEGSPAPAPAPVPGGPARPGQPVARTPSASPGPVRTWPFDRWQEEAAAAAERGRALATLLGAPPQPGPRRRRRRVVALGLVALSILVAVVLVRSSAPDSTRRPPAPRPPPTATPGGKP